MYRFTSVAFAHSDSPNVVKLVQSWPNGRNGGIGADQVPTELHYTNTYRRARLWGYEIPRGGQNSPVPLQWFKLLLQISMAPEPEAGEQSEADASQGFLRRETQDFRNLSIGESSFQAPTTTPADVAAKKLREFGLRPVEVVADFLSDVRDATIKSIQDSWGAGFANDSRIEYVLSIPAIWTDAAKNHMIQAAESAGYGKHRTDFRLISEPEAAASYTLKAMLPRKLEVGLLCCSVDSVCILMLEVVRRHLCDMRCWRRNRRPHLLQTPQSTPIHR